MKLDSHAECVCENTEQDGPLKNVMINKVFQEFAKSTNAPRNGINKGRK